MSAPKRQYRVLKAVGRGGFGTVYQAQLLGDAGFHKEVALKVLNPEISTPEVAARLRDEARMLGLIRHRAIIQVDELVRLRDSWAVVMEYVDGADLRRLRSLGRLPPSCALTVIAEIAGALNAAFEAVSADGIPLRIVHRDIKPSNIQITRTGAVKLLDFGAARADFDTREALTEGVVLGTIRYMAPERFEGIDSAAGDVYALGVVAAELMAPGRASKPQLLDTLRESLGPEYAPVVELVARCLSPEASDRPTHAQLERQAWELSQTFSRPRIQDWASEQVPKAQVMNTQADGALTGEVLREETLSTGPTTLRHALGVATVGASTMLGFGLLVLGCAGLVGVGVLLSPADVPITVSPPSSPPVPVHITGDDSRPVQARSGQEPRDPLSTLPTKASPSPPSSAPRPSATRPTPASTARVIIDGGGSDVVLIGPAGRFNVPGNVPPGLYVVQFAGSEALKNVELSAGQTLRLTCDPMFGMCRR